MFFSRDSKHSIYLTYWPCRLLTVFNTKRKVLTNQYRRANGRFECKCWLNSWTLSTFYIQRINSIIDLAQFIMLRICNVYIYLKPVESYLTYWSSQNKLIWFFNICIYSIRSWFQLLVVFFLVVVFFWCFFFHSNKSLTLKSCDQDNLLTIWFRIKASTKWST